MPEINKVFTLKITPEQFLNACSPLELQEVELLIGQGRYQERMNQNGSYSESSNTVIKTKSIKP